MNNYIPTEVKDLTDSKQRVMQNVVNKIETNSKRPKRRWRYGLITAVLAMSAMLFVINEIFIEDNKQPAIAPALDVTELPLDLTKPTLSEEQGLLYLNGVTIGDSQATVREQLGEKYTIVIEDGSGADFVLDYDGKARFYFYEEKLLSIVLMKVDKNHFDKLFNDYEDVKINSSTDDDRYIYSKETSHILKATFVPDGNLYLYLFYAGPDISENSDFDFLNLK